jgi:RNA polymerase sigma factor for flagellar operon FliA
VTGSSLLLRYRRTRKVSVRNQIVERYRDDVESVAQELHTRLPRSVDLQDLVHAGIWGLIQAIDNFEPERGTHFLPFMRLRVRGAMIDELRHLDYLPRLFRMRLKALEDAQLRLRGTLDRDPSDQELASELGVSESVMRRRYASVIPLHQSWLQAPHESESEDGTHSSAIDALEDDGIEAPIEIVHRRELLELISQTLEPIEWSVLRLHYLEGMSGKDVARKLRLSASRICQIHGRVLSRLKARLSACS